MSRLFVIVFLVEGRWIGKSMKFWVDGRVLQPQSKLCVGGVLASFGTSVLFHVIYAYVNIEL